MYRTIEADIENGRVVGAGASELPQHAHVLITLLPGSFREDQRDFSDLAGRLKWRGDAVAEQRKLRDEW